MIISIHQPSYLPWLPFIEKAIKSDIFVFLDDVQFEKNSEQNRNKIKTSSGPSWLTIPVKRSLNSLISEVEIPQEQSKWVKKHINTIEQNYFKTPYYNDVIPELFDIIKSHNTNFMSLNINIDEYFLSLANFKGEIEFSSNLGIKKKKSNKILSICKNLGAKTYLSGSGGRDYLNLNDFKSANIEVLFQDYLHYEYNQAYMKLGFIPNLSALDFFCNYGLKNKARDRILKSSRWN